jgi:hypothetical protein
MGVLCGGATGNHVTGRDPVQKYVMRMRNRKLPNIRPSEALWPEIGYRKFIPALFP